MGPLTVELVKAIETFLDSVHRVVLRRREWQVLFERLESYKGYYSTVVIEPMYVFPWLQKR